MPGLPRGGWTDEEILVVLHKHEVEGTSTTVIAQRFGKGRGAVIGLIHRIRKAHAEIPCECRREENKDGGMSPGWWKR